MKLVIPQFFCISDISNSLSDCSQTIKKICVVEVCRSNVLKRLAGVVFDMPFCILSTLSSVWLFLAFRAQVVGFEVEVLDFRFVVVTLLGLLLLLPSSSKISPEQQLP